MRTKALLGLAALAVGAITAQAQSNVYSLNIVGYYNVPLNYTLNAVANQLNAGSPQNRADQVLPYNDGDNIQMWNGVKWVQYTMDSGAGTGWADSTGADVPLTSLPLLSPGKLFFYAKAGTATNLTFVGEVPMGTNTLPVASGVLSAVASMIPYAGKIVTGPMAAPLPVDASSVQLWNGVKWVLYNYDSGAGTGWSDSTGSDVAEPQVAVGEGFFSANTSGATVNWIQVLNP